MKKTLIILTSLILGAFTVSAQNFMVVNTEKIFKALPAYEAAVNEIDVAAKQYQDNIDAAYEKIEEQYNTYMRQKASLSQAEQQKREETIINNEKRIVEYQEEVFGTDGALSKLQQEKLEPTQKHVMEVITKYAKDNKLGLVLDVATNPMVIYYEPDVDKTEQIIALLK